MARTPPRRPPAAAPRRGLPIVAVAVATVAVGVLLGVLLAWATGAGTSPARSGTGAGDAVPAWVGHEPAGRSTPDLAMGPIDHVAPRAGGVNG